MNAAAIKPRPGDIRVPSAIAGIWIFILVELMFFMALISAASIVHAGAGDNWAGDAFHGLGDTVQLVNLLSLLTSGVLAIFGRLTLIRNRPKGLTMLLGSLILGGLFVSAQGAEWAVLLTQGVTLQATRHAGFYYLIVGAHAVHAVAGIMFLGIQVLKLQHGEQDESLLDAALLFWGLVVFIWPLLFVAVYP